MLVHHLQHWPNIATTLGQHFMFAGLTVEGNNNIRLKFFMLLIAYVFYDNTTILPVLLCNAAHNPYNTYVDHSKHSMFLLAPI